GALEGVDSALRREGSSLRELRLDEIGGLTDGRRELRELLAGTLETRELTGEALEVLGAERFDPRELGRLLNEHQAILGRRLKVSTEKIDRMLRAAMEAGALGGKLNGSGGGGCMFAYAPEDPERVARAIEEVGGRAYVIHQDQGVHMLAASGVRRDGAV
ncbi:MAG TPA: GHMP kinase, partial [Bacteroidetes bacterium]|nr:GHMP kinase [Bacteroidota bacterium]